MKADSTPKYREKTRLNNLVRHTNGLYYARLYLNGKEKWQSLKTSHFSVAEAKLAELQKEHREHRDKAPSLGDAKMTFGQPAAVHMQRLEERLTIKRQTKKCWRITSEALVRSWPELPAREVRRINPEACCDWANRYAKSARDNRDNNGGALLRHVFEVAIELCVTYANPAGDLERVTVRGKS